MSEINDLTAQVAQKDERIAELEKFKITTDISDKVRQVGKLTPTAPDDSQRLPTTPDSSLRLQTHAVVGSQ